MLPIAALSHPSAGATPTSLPESVRESWGEPAADDFARWLDKLDKYVRDHAVARDEYREVLSRLDVLANEGAAINECLDRMEERFEDRFGQMNARFNHLEERFANRFSQMDERIDRMHEQIRVMMRWTVGTSALFGTIVTVLLAIAEFAP